MTMFSKETLLTPNEILRFLGLSEDLKVCSFSQLFGIEFAAFRDCLGLDFREDLISDLVDYSGAQEFVLDTNYNAGDTVVQRGLLFTAIVNTVNVSPPIKNDSNASWKIADKFTTECNNELWCLFLGEFLSWCALQNRAPSLIMNLSSKGLLLPKNEKSSPADGTTTTRYLQWVQKQLDRAKENLFTFLARNQDVTCFAKFLGFKCGSCSSYYTLCGCGKSKYTKEDNSACTEGGYDFPYDVY